MIQSARPLDAQTLRDGRPAESTHSDRSPDAQLSRIPLDRFMPVSRHEWQAVAASAGLSPNLEGSNND